MLRSHWFTGTAGRRTTALTILVIAVFAMIDVMCLPRSQLVVSSENVIDLVSAGAMLAVCALIAKFVAWPL